MIPFFITIGAVNLFLGLFVLLKEFKQKINGHFAAFAIFTAFLIFLDLILRINQDIFVLKIAFAFASFIPCIGVLNEEKANAILRTKIAFAFASFIPCIGVLWVSELK